MKNSLRIAPVVPIVGIFILGTLLRFYSLGSESVWVDEGWTFRQVALPFNEMMGEIANDYHPPLYFVILHYWIQLFGASEISMRAPSAIFGCLTILVVYRLGALLFDRKVALVCSLLFAASVLHIRYAQEARMYSLLSLTAAASFLFLIGMQKKQSRASRIGYIVSTALLLYSHIYSLFILLAQNIYVLATWLFEKKVDKVPTKNWLTVQLIVLALFLPWIAVLIEQVSSVQEGFWIEKPTGRTIYLTFLTWSNAVHPSLENNSPLHKPVFLLSILLACLSIWRVRRTHGTLLVPTLFTSLKRFRWELKLQDVRVNVLLLLWALVSVVVPFLISQFLQPIYYVRYTIAASIPMYILMARGICTFDRRDWIRHLALLLVIVGVSIPIYDHYTRQTKDNWRDAVQYVEGNARTDDLLLIHTAFMKDNAYDYYSNRRDLELRGFPGHGSTAHWSPQFIEPATHRDELRTIASGYQRIWLILSHSRDHEEFIRRTLMETHTADSYRTFTGIEVYLLER